MASRRRSGSKAPTTNAPFSAPLSVPASGPLTARMIPAPLSTSARLPIVAPATWKSASGMDAESPAPLSTATSAASATNFFTVSGIAAHRVSPAGSFRTAIFIGRSGLLEDQEDDEADDQAADRAPFHQLRELLVVADMRRDFLCPRAGQQRLFFMRHEIPLLVCSRSGGP